MSYYNESSELSFSEKETYIRDHFHDVFCGYNMDQIDKDNSLSDNQKDALKEHLMRYGD